jgi:hypothetical protein
LVDAQAVLAGKISRIGRNCLDAVGGSSLLRLEMAAVVSSF